MNVVKFTKVIFSQKAGVKCSYCSFLVYKLTILLELLDNVYKFVNDLYQNTNVNKFNLF